MIMSRYDVLLRSGFGLSLVAFALLVSEQVLEIVFTPGQAIREGSNEQ
jgi:hypothetical protein